jgi:O-antigen ligase
LFFWFFFFLFLVLFTNGRSGAIIIILQLVLIAALTFHFWFKVLKISFFPLLLFYFAIESDALKPVVENVANNVEAINPRFAELMRGEESGDLTMDKSWLTRKLMVDKGYEIFLQYPFFGIGVNNFIYFDSRLVSFRNYDRLGDTDMDFWNSRSAHNTYVQVAVEFGVLAFLIFLVLLFFPIIAFLLKLRKGLFSFDFLPFISLLGISIHFYAISGLTAAVAWMTIGLAWGSYGGVIKKMTLN